MNNHGAILLAVLLLLFQTGCTPNQTSEASTREPVEITLLFTNDLESTYDPVVAYWRDDM